MAKSNTTFKQYLQMSRDLIKRIKNSVGSIYYDAMLLLCETFVSRARARLSRKYGAAKFANNIYYRLNGINGQPEIVVRENEEGIMTFLEYGTGISGSDNPHPLAKGFWEYTIHPEKYRKVDGKYGFFFRHKQGRYIDENDRLTISLDGDSMFGDLIFSQGIKPVRYLYDTEMEIIRIYNQASNIFDFVNMLEKLKRSPLKDNE